MGAIEGGGFSYSKEDLDKMRNIDRCINARCEDIVVL